MRIVPALDTRYWVAMLFASLLGTTFGDFVSNDLGLGFAKGLIPLGLILAGIFVAERKSSEPNEAFYWLAIVVTRTMATNLADLATHGDKIDYKLVAGVLIAMLAVTLLVRNALGGSRQSQHDSATTYDKLPKINTTYWVAMLIASTLGTTLGDFLSEGLGLGFQRAAIILSVVLAAVVFVQRRARIPSAIYYWFAIVVVRTTGTVLGDYTSTEEGLNLGFLTAAATVAIFLICVLNFWTSRGPGGVEQLSARDEPSATG